MWKIKLYSKDNLTLCNIIQQWLSFWEQKRIEQMWEESVCVKIKDRNASPSGSHFNIAPRLSLTAIYDLFCFS